MFVYEQQQQQNLVRILIHPLQRGSSTSGTPQPLREKAPFFLAWVQAGSQEAGAG